MRFSIILTAALAFLVTMPAQAVTVYLNQGQGLADTDIAQLDYSINNNNVTFTLSYLMLSSLGSKSFLSALSVDTTETHMSKKDLKKTYTTSAASGGGVASVGLSNGAAGGDYDFAFDFTGKEQDRLTNGEALTWTLTKTTGNFSDNFFTSFKAHVQGMQGINNSEGTPVTSAWYGSSDTSLAPPVPEPETWGMLLAGLGLMAMQLRRRAKEQDSHRLLVA